MAKWSHREYRTRLAWIEKQWNEPNRSDHYAMYIAFCVQNVLNTKPAAFKGKEYTIPFERIKPVDPKIARKRALAKEKALWFRCVGYVRPQSD